MRKLTLAFICLVWQCVLVPAIIQGQDTAGECLTCHKEKTPGLYKQWNSSKHAENDITCDMCHEADKSDPDAYEHHGTIIATLVTPSDCGNCHDQEASEFGNSRHAEAGMVLESGDAYQANVVAGLPAAIQGCESCHGTIIKIDNSSPNKLSGKEWPNSGIGRVNPDGSKGSCTACHTRHAFSVAQARQPESCSKCHLGPDHPQREIYEESKHGNAYYTGVGQMNLNSSTWVVGIDYFEAPTCATCHMAATRDMSSSHNVGSRLSWILRSPISKRTENWQQKRINMKKVCTNCHSSVFVDGHYYQFDALVNLYDVKFAVPAGRIMKLIKKNNVLENPADFGNNIEWTYWELWHHEGRRARQGSAMIGPDYVWWHGMYEIGKHFYFELIPEARGYNNAEVNTYIDSLLTNDPMHSWINDNTSDLKGALKSGELQKMYERVFESK